jgi:hypothetical protein
MASVILTYAFSGSSKPSPNPLSLLPGAWGEATGHTHSHRSAVIGSDSEARRDRDGAGYRGHHAEQDRSCQENDRVACIAFCPFREHPVQGQRKPDTGHNTAPYTDQSRPKYDAQHISALCAERHTNAKFVGPLRHRIRHHAVKTHCGQKQGEPRKEPENPSGQVLLLPFRLIRDPGVQILRLETWKCLATDIPYPFGVLLLAERGDVPIPARPEPFMSFAPACRIPGTNPAVPSAVQAGDAVDTPYLPFRCSACLAPGRSGPRATSTTNAES